MPWYYVAAEGDPPEQGEQIFQFPTLRAGRDADGNPVVYRRLHDVIIATQSCDLVQQKVTDVLLASTYSLEDWLQDNPGDFGQLEAIRQGFDASLYILPAWPEAPHERAKGDRIVDFGRLHTVALDEVDAICTAGAARIVLASPSREHFAQAVARSFMRVGLPMDLPSFEMENVGRVDDQFPALRGADDLLHGRTLRVVAPLPILVLSRRRRATGETFTVLVSRDQPQLIGVGRSRDQADISFSRQVVRREEALEQGAASWGWLRKYVRGEPSPA